MNEADRHRRLMELFEQAADLPPGQRSRFLAEQCGGDGALRRDLEWLLKHDAEPSPVIEAAARGGAIDALAEMIADPPNDGGSHARSSLPARIGRYRIVRRIGAGGMGVVYEAEQDRPRRRVAVKIISHALVSGQALWRFEQEAQVLGLLQHAGIAQIIEAGADDLGAGPQPYFAMEFIDGLPLVEYAEDRRLDVRGRLGLICKICEALEHAHQRGVIHRDLKPANILVDDAGQPRILDFGVARATIGTDAVTAMRTHTQQIIGTVPYMAPEQLAGDTRRIDARADVYSLGVVCFEMLTGRLPFEVRSLPLAEAARRIQEQEPSHLSSINATLRGDIETIVGRALEKDPNRRYPSAAAFGADIQRFLDDKPIVARPPSAIYQLRKFTKRNKGLVAGLAATFVVLITGAAVATWLAIAAQRAQRVAEANEASAVRENYRMSLAAAAAAIENHERVAAQNYLDDAPEALRGWEWRHLRARLDMSTRGASIEGVKKPAAGFSPDGESVIVVDRAPGGGNDVMVLDAASGRRLPNLGTHWRLWMSQVLWEQTRAVDGVLVIPDDAGETRRISLASMQVDPDQAIACLRVSRDRRRLAFCTLQPPEATLHFVELGRSQPRVVQQRISDLNSVLVAMTADGRRVATAATRDSRLRSRVVVWDFDSGRAICEIQDIQAHVTGLAFALDGSKLVTAGRAGVVRLSDAQTGLTLAEARGHNGAIWRAAVSPDGSTVATVGADGTVRLWRADHLAPFAVLLGHEDAVVSLDFSPDGSMLITASDDGTVRWWHAGLPSNPRVLAGHGGFVYPVVISPDGRLVASAGWDESVRLWRFNTGQPIAEFTEPRRPIIHLAFSADGRQLLNIETQAIRLYDVEQALMQHELERPIPQWPLVGFDESAKRVLIDATPGASSTWWEPESDRIIERPFEAIREAVTPRVSRAADAVVLLGECESGPSRCLSLHRITDGERLAEVSPGLGYAAAFSPDAGSVAMARDDRRIEVFDTRSGASLAVLSGHEGDIYCLAFSPDGTRLASAGERGVIHFWRTTHWDELVRLRGHTSYIWSLAFSPDGSALASGSGDSTVRIWSAK